MCRNFCKIDYEFFTPNLIKNCDEVTLPTNTSIADIFKVPPRPKVINRISVNSKKDSVTLNNEINVRIFVSLSSILVYGYKDIRILKI